MAFTTLPAKDNGDSIDNTWVDLTKGNFDDHESRLATAIADVANSVRKTGNETIAGIKTLTDYLVTAGLRAAFAALTSNTTLTANHQVVTMDCTGGARTVTLPAAASNSGRFYTVKKIDQTVNTCTIDPNSSETLEWVTTVILYGRGDFATFVSDGTNWIMVSRTPSWLLTFGFTTTGADTTARFSIPGGPSAAAGTSTVEYVIPISRAGVLRKLRVYSNTASAADICIFTARKNYADTALTVSMPASSQGNIEDATHEVAVAVGDKISLKHVMNSAAAGPSGVTATIEFVPN